LKSSAKGNGRSLVDCRHPTLVQKKGRVPNAPAPPEPQKWGGEGMYLMDTA